MPATPNRRLTMQDIRKPVQAQLDAVNRLIISNLESDVALVENIGHYIVDAGGKRLRPLLALLGACCCEYRGEQQIKFAALVEFIHTATLLHDDVVDISTLRRGRPTANAEFGNASSVLVGDFLYTRAFQLMVEIGDMDIMRDMATTTNTIATGEVLQLVRAGDPETSEAQYLDVITRKTAVLFASACFGGAALAGRATDLGPALRDFGLNTGIAFQIIDDVLDYEGDPAEMGKNVGDDLNEGKPTLPLIHVMQSGDSAQKATVAGAIRDKDAGRIDDVMAAVLATGSLDYARQQAEHYQALAIEALAQLPDNSCRDSMAAIAKLAIRRTQ
jgi:octaprenyl-diphosphate synthase